MQHSISAARVNSQETMAGTKVLESYAQKPAVYTHRTDGSSWEHALEKRLRDGAWHWTERQGLQRLFTGLGRWFSLRNVCCARWGHEFDPQNPCFENKQTNKTGGYGGVYNNAGVGELETGKSLGLTGQPVYPSQWSLRSHWKVTLRNTRWSVL